ncbi:MAG: hypothetical protein ACPHW5_05115 [Candidatus Puniceispirillales bacterium]
MARIVLLDDMQMGGMNLYNPDFHAPENCICFWNSTVARPA